MSWLNTEPSMEISTSSGLLRVTLHPARSWLLALIEFGFILLAAVLTYREWAHAAMFLRGIFVFSFLSVASALVFQFSGSEIIEISRQALVLVKEIHGWERKRGFSVDDCRELEWTEASEDSPSRLQCKTGRRAISFAEHLTEAQADEIFKALQQTVPEVARQLCTYSAGKSHFISLISS